MTAYLIARIEVHDPEGYEAYKARTPAIIAKFGGRFLVRGGALETLEGEESVGRLVLVEFPDMDAARGFYNSAEYQAAIRIREPASKGQFVIVEGI
jgi:uncharacterized protein (DUF1330 family)